MLISNAYAQAAAGGADAGGGLMGLLPIVIMFIILWFLMIRPQMKKAKDHTKMVGELQKGDEIVTQGGMAGRITKVGESFLTLEIATAKDGPIEVAVQKNAIGALLPKGTLKSL
ncbi:MAG: preprotein translocase subunit YajC [Gammaproteobacteria bacterium]|nr:preprotein translocase subunit YajC [Gammaproteobacteria bacterium]MBU1647164.1 preprotein translocase subunit YajC [Gammaproteobacteria bacterium]MBU1972676.1 preprotein translocase subunit YajC [Gammaproteobacteria bacterium]